MSNVFPLYDRMVAAASAGNKCYNLTQTANSIADLRILNPDSFIDHQNKIFALVQYYHILDKGHYSDSPPYTVGRQMSSGKNGVFQDLSHYPESLQWIIAEYVKHYSHD
jgi:hypothetical protein